MTKGKSLWMKRLWIVCLGFQPEVFLTRLGSHCDSNIFLKEWMKRFMLRAVIIRLFGTLMSQRWYQSHITVTHCMARQISVQRLPWTMLSLLQSMPAFVFLRSWRIVVWCVQDWNAVVRKCDNSVVLWGARHLVKHCRLKHSLPFHLTT